MALPLPLVNTLLWVKLCCFYCTQALHVNSGLQPSQNKTENVSWLFPWKKELPRWHSSQWHDDYKADPQLNYKVNSTNRLAVLIKTLQDLTNWQLAQHCHVRELACKLTSAAPTRDLSADDFSLLNVRHSEPTSITLCRKQVEFSNTTPTTFNHAVRTIITHFTHCPHPQYLLPLRHALYKRTHYKCFHQECVN